MAKFGERRFRVGESLALLVEGGGGLLANGVEFVGEPFEGFRFGLNLFESRGVCFSERAFIFRELFGVLVGEFDERIDVGERLRSLSAERLG